MFPLRDDNPTHHTPVVTIALIVVNVLVFLWEMALGEQARLEMFAQFALTPAYLTGGAPYAMHLPAPLTIVTSMFLHGGLMHAGGNMLYLWIFGNNIEDRMGMRRFILFYLLCGVAAALLQVVASPNSRVPMVGASGAIAGVLGAYLVLFPRARVLVVMIFGFLVRTSYVPAMLVLGLWFVLQLFNGVGTLGVAHRADTGGVAFFAHIGGFVAGLALVKLFARRDAPDIEPY
jgi:membrane associated rhomboid family serine protease